jgi:hypothetical protein
MDKEKALRALVKITGKAKVKQFLDDYAGAPDIIDRLEEYILHNLH